jgi:hypothetical protein
MVELRPPFGGIRPGQNDAGERVQNGITKHVIQNAIPGRGVQNAN